MKEKILNSYRLFRNRVQTSLYKNRATRCIESRKDIDPRDIEKISMDIPFAYFRAYTNEKWVQNDYYGIATDIKKYSGADIDKPLDCVIEHGVYFFENSKYDLSSGGTKILTMSEFRKERLGQVSEKKIVTIGPPIYYASEPPNKRIFFGEKKRLGKNLLAFPAHSSHSGDVIYDVEEFCDYLDEAKKAYDTVRVCLYWKDVLLGRDRLFRQRGFECVCAGHVFDPWFNSRLKKLVQLSSATASNSVGSILGYSLLLNRPHYIYRQKIQSDGGSVDSNRHTSKIDSAFRVRPGSEVSKNQVDIADKYWGLSEIKSKSEMRSIISEGLI